MCMIFSGITAVLQVSIWSEQAIRGPEKLSAKKAASAVGRMPQNLGRNPHVRQKAAGFPAHGQYRRTGGVVSQNFKETFP